MIYLVWVKCTTPFDVELGKRSTLVSADESLCFKVLDTREWRVTSTDISLFFWHSMCRFTTGPILIYDHLSGINSITGYCFSTVSNIFNRPRFGYTSSDNTSSQWGWHWCYPLAFAKTDVHCLLLPEINFIGRFIYLDLLWWQVLLFHSALRMDEGARELFNPWADLSFRWQNYLSVLVFWFRNATVSGQLHAGPPTTIGWCVFAFYYPDLFASLS